MAAVVGLYNGEDIALGGTFFNKISDDQCAWIITDLEGWWGLPDVEVTDDPKTQSLDGSYFTFGRHLPRTISMRGQILPLDGAANKAVAARSTLNRLLAPMARNRVLLSVQEDNPKVSLVQLAGQPLTTIDKTTGQLTFDIVLRAVDPVKYSQENHIVSTSLAATAPGRTYNKTFYYSYGGKTTDGQIAADNIGSYSSDATFTITGPVTRPRIEHVEQGVFLEFNVVLGIGETLTINTRTKKILFGGASRRNTLTPQSRWFTLTPGRNTIRYSGTQQIPAQVQLPAGTNLLTNPSFEATSGTVEVRRNLVSDPRATVNGLVAGQARWAPRWFGTGGAGTVTLVSGASDGPEVAPGVRVPTYLRKTWTTGAGVGDTGFDHTQISPSTPGAGTNGLPVVAGATYTASSYLRARTANTGAKFYMRIVFRNAAGERIVGPSWGGAEVPATNDTWTPVSFTVTAPANAVTVSIATDMGGTGSWAAADTLDGTALDIEVSPVTLPYMDGTVSPDSDLTASWTGAANASPSVLTGVGVTGAQGNSARYFFSSTQWAATGTRSLRTTSGGLYTSPGGDTGALRNGMVAGKTYTILATCRLERPQTGTVDGLSRRIVAYTKIGAAAYVGINSVAAPNIAGVHEVRLTFTVPVGATEAFFRLFSGGSASNGDVWWDNLALVEGEYTGPYFDGSSPFASWTGTPNASTSTRPFVPEVPETMLQLSYRDAWID